MYSPIQLDIIRTFGSKELSEGCLIQIKWEYLFTIMDIEGDVANCYHPLKCTKDRKRSIIDIEISKLDGERNKILGHIPELFPDVARVAKGKAFIYTITPLRLGTYEIGFNDGYRTTYINYTPEMPLLEQSEETLTKLLNIFKPS